MTREPAVLFGAIAEIIKAVVPMLILFGVLHWTAAQVAQVMIVVGVVVGSLTVVFVRAQTVPTVTSDALIATAVKLPATTSVETVKAEQAAKDAK